MAAGLVNEWLATKITHKMPAATLEGVRLALRAGPLDISKARREIGFMPRPIEPALAQAVTWLAEITTKRGAN
jgi:dihydroflavonol-4-reductase